MKSKIVRTLCLLIVVAGTAAAQQFVSNVSKRGTTAAQFLAIGQGSRALGMGSAFVAVADDPSAMYWNPAGLADLSGNRIMFDYTQWIADVNYNFIGTTVNIGSYGVIGLNFTSSNIPDMKVTTIESPDGTGETFGVTDAALGLSYALKLTDKFSIGFNPKFVYQKIWKMSASAAAIDLGVKYETPFKGIVLGMSITNFGTKMKMSGNSSLVLYDPDPMTTGNNGRIPADVRTDEWSMPLNFKVGIAYSVLKDETNNLLVAVDAAHPSDNYESVNVGAEYVFNDFIEVRGGYKSMFLQNSEETFSLGFGVRHTLIGATQLSFDYAYQDFQRLKNVQKFTLGLIF